MDFDVRHGPDGAQELAINRWAMGNAVSARSSMYAPRVVVCATFWAFGVAGCAGDHARDPSHTRRDLAKTGRSVAEGRNNTPRAGARTEREAFSEFRTADQREDSKAMCRLSAYVPEHCVRRFDEAFAVTGPVRLEILGRSQKQGEVEYPVRATYRQRGRLRRVRFGLAVVRWHGRWFVGNVAN